MNRTELLLRLVNFVLSLRLEEASAGEGHVLEIGYEDRIDAEYWLVVANCLEHDRLYRKESGSLGC